MSRARRSENSGLIDLDALMREAAASAPELPVAPDESGPRAVVRDPAPAPTADDSLEAVVGDTKPSPPPPSPAATSPARAAASPDAKRPRTIARALAGLAAALAAGSIVGFVAFHATRGGGGANANAKASSPATASATSPAATTSPSATTTSPTSAALPAAATLDARDLPAAALPGAPAAATTPPARPTAARPQITERDLPPSAGERADLGGAIAHAVGPKDAPAEAALDVPRAGGAARQLRPSPGAVVGAIGAVLPAARACLGADDPVRAGEITFRSDGAVARVRLAGARPTDACVTAALSRARVEPFVEETFTTRVTVRP